MGRCSHCGEMMILQSYGWVCPSCGIPLSPNGKPNITIESSHFVRNTATNDRSIDRLKIEKVAPHPWGEVIDSENSQSSKALRNKGCTAKQLKK